MLHKWFLARHPRRTPNRRSVLRKSTFEALEARALLAATTVGPAMQLAGAPYWPFASGSASDAIVWGDGSSMVAYDGRANSDRQGIVLQEVDADGNLMTEAQTLVNTTSRGPQFDPGLAAAEDGSYAVVWSGRGSGDRQGIFVQRFQANGNRNGGETRVNETTGGAQQEPAIAMAPDGSAVVVWQGVGEGDFDGVFARRLDTNGQPIGDEFRVNTATISEQSHPAVAIDADGHFVVVWKSRGQDGSDWGVYGQRFSADGTPAGQEFRVNTTTDRSQTDPSVSMNNDGDFVVAWSSFGNGAAGWDVFAQRYNASGQAMGSEFRLHQDAQGHQRDADIAMAEAGELLASWSHAQSTGGWSVRARTFNSDGASDGDELTMPVPTNGSTLAHRRNASTALSSEGDGLVIYQGNYSTTQTTLFVQRLNVDVEPAANVAPELQNVAEQTVSVGETLDIVITATDANAGDVLTFRLDTEVSPSSATITKTSATTARVQWTPTSTDRNQRRGFRVIVEDNGEPVMSDAVQFFVNVANAAPVVDLNGTNGSGIDFAVTYDTAGSAVTIVDSDLVVTDADQTQLSSATATLIPVRDGASEVLSVNTTGTSITASYNSSTGLLTLTGTASLAHYQQVLRTLRYDNTAANPNLTQRRVEIRVNDGTSNSAVATSTITLVAAGSPTAVNDTFTVSEDAVAQPLNVLANDNTGPGQGVQLTITAVTTPSKGSTATIDTVNNRILYTPASTASGTETFNYTISRPNGTTSTATVTINIDNQNDAPTLAALPNVTLLAGSPLHIGLDAEDQDGDVLTFAVTSSNPSLVSPTVLTGNRSLRLSVENFGDMVFELFEDRASRATEQIIELAEEGFYEDVIFHRVINNFMIQGGDPTGTGAGGSDKGDFDDQFHVDLQHNTRGQLSMAKSLDDTNDSQFFITEGPARHLDSNHTIFGQLVEGDAVREAISNVPTNSSNRPLTNVVIEKAEVFVDNENGVLMLKAPEGATGTATVTVTVTDSSGASSMRQFTVTVAADTQNSPPWLADIPTLTTPVNTPTTFQLTAVDVEGNSAVFLDEDLIDTINASLSEGSRLPVPVRAPANLDYSVDPNTGMLTITPSNGLTGTHRIVVATAASLTGLNALSPIDYQVITVNIG